MSISPEPASNSDQVNLEPVPQELWVKSINECLRFNDPGTFIVLPQYTDVASIAQGIAAQSRRKVIDAQAFVSGKPLKLEEDEKGLVVINYGSHNTGTKGEIGAKIEVQNRIRLIGQDRSKYYQGVVVITTQMPDARDFHHPYPWHNGPFNNIWIVSRNPEGLNIQKYVASGITEEDYKWIPKGDPKLIK